MNNQIIRCSIRSLYDMQKLRIQNGNRICAAFRYKLGLEPSQAEEEDEDANELLKDLRREFKRITDGVKRVTKNIKCDSPLITSRGELALLEAYERQIEAEHIHEIAIADELTNLPIWTSYLSAIRGVGPLMAGVLLSEIDIHKCNSISALWKYAGVDCVVWFEIKECFSDAAPSRLETRHPEGYSTEGPPVTGTDDNWFTLYDNNAMPLGKYGLPAADTPGFGQGRSKRKEHLIPKTYVNSNGEIKETVGITYNPFLKTKLLGVLGSVFIRLGGPYRDVYTDHKVLLQENPRHAEKSKMHIHKMAVRHMMQDFLADLWTEWRQLEGLPVRSSYKEEKLGKKAA